MASDEHATLRGEIAELARDVAAEFELLARWLDSPDELWTFRPTPDAWSVGEILEHVTLANHFLLILAHKLAETSKRRAERGDVVPSTPLALEGLRAVSDPSLRWAHPVHMTPTQSVTREELRARLTTQSAECARLLRELPSGEGHLHRIRMSVLPGENRLDLYQYLAFLALHSARHREQMQRNARARDGDHRART